MLTSKMALLGYRWPDTAKKLSTSVKAGSLPVHKVHPRIILEEDTGRGVFMFFRHGHGGFEEFHQPMTGLRFHAVARTDF